MDSKPLEFDWEREAAAELADILNMLCCRSFLSVDDFSSRVEYSMRALKIHHGGKTQRQKVIEFRERLTDLERSLRDSSDLNPPDESV